jgi:hypothetical protein
MMNKILAGLFAAAASIGVAQADELLPMQAKSVALGEMTGIAYYTVTEKGYEIVATVAHGETGMPMRFVASLVPGQSVTLSVPRSAGQAALEMEIARVGDTVLVSEQNTTAAAMN